MTVSRPYSDQSFTLEQYLALPENERMEIMEGVPYMLASPSDAHQNYAGGLYAALRSYLRGKTCKARIAPLDVFLNENTYRPTVVQPDVFVVCDPGKLDKRGCHGAPDLIIEIKSPSSKRHDELVKLNMYTRYGIREYWLVDPDEQIVQQCVLDGGSYRIHGVFGATEKIKVAVLDDCTIDLAEIFAE